jgi:hypothetical protein
MSNPFGALRSRYDRITISTIHVAFALSLLLHLMAMWEWSSKIKMRPFEDVRMGEQGGTLAVRIAKPPTPPTPPPRPAPSAESPPVPERRLTMPKSAPRSAPPPSARRLLATERQARSASMAPPPRPTEAARPAAGDDLASYIESRRRNREPESQAAPASQASPPAESDQARQNREAAARLGFSATPTFGSNKNLGGGTFQVRSIGIERAELAFYGYNKLIKRISLQVFEVPRGSNPSTQLAVVRKIIEIIREQENGTFLWESLRLRRDLTLSARPADNASLEAFMMEEFFSDGRQR